ncbi:CPCC family cysteine-rich protein [Streptomyces sp. NPDC005388]|uniref:CPCC family cysteine-rich protein n=1 Tax=Streptomyces sp. NPDC005388 TaxID=3156717 RepID=UPI0033B2568E
MDQDALVTLIHVRGSVDDGPYRCPCCGFITLAERGAYEICPVCLWEDDGQDEHDADAIRGGPNRGLSLRGARRNFHDVGACDDRRTRFVHEPLPHEHPDSGTPYGTGSIHPRPPNQPAGPQLASAPQAHQI